MSIENAIPLIVSLIVLGLPFCTAIARNHPNQVAISILNLFALAAAFLWLDSGGYFGADNPGLMAIIANPYDWWMPAWVAAMVWSLTRIDRPKTRDDDT